MRRPTRRNILLVTGMILSIIGVFWLPRWLDPNRHIAFISDQAGALLGGKVSVSAIHWGILEGCWLQLEQLAISDTTLIPADLSVQRIYARAALRPLLSGKLVIEQVVIDKPTVTYRLMPAADEPTANADNTEATHLNLPISVLAMELHQGQLTIEDRVTHPEQTLAHRFAAIEIALSQIGNGQPLDFSLAANTLSARQQSGEPAHGTLRFAGQLQGLNPGFAWEKPWLDAELDIQQLPLAGFSGYLDDATMIHQPLNGRFSGHLNYQGDLRGQSQTHALLELGAIQYHNPKLWPQPMPGSPLTIEAHVHQTATDLRLETLTIDAQELIIKGSGTVQAWQQQPALSDSVFSATLPLEKLANYIPWPLLGSAAQPARDLLLGNKGVVTLSEFTLPPLTFGEPIDANQLIAKTHGRADFIGVSAPLGPNRPTVEDLEGKLYLADNSLRGTAIKATIGALRLPETRLTVHQLTTQPRIDAAIRGVIDTRKVSMQRKRQLVNQLTGDNVDLHDFDLRAELAIAAYYDHAKPQQWRAEGHVDINTLRVATLSPKAVLSAQGQIELQRRQSLNLLIQKIKGRINGSPYSIAGQLFALGEPHFLADLQLNLSQLKLQKLTPWLNAFAPPHLQPKRLAGRLSTNIDVYYPQAKPARTRIRGPITLHNGRLYLPAEDSALSRYLPADGLLLEHINAALRLAPEKSYLDKLTLKANDQLFTLRGSVQNPQHPRIKLQLHSPRVNLNRLIPATQSVQSTVPPPIDPQPTSTIQPVPHLPQQQPLPRLIRQATAALKIDIDSGRYRGENFNQLLLTADYKQGRIERAIANINIAGGSVRAQGSANLLNLSAIPLRLNYHIKDLDLARLTPLFSKDGTTLASGQLSSIASLRSNTSNLKHHLRGELSLRTGPGKIPNRSVASNALFSILSLIDVQGLLSGDIGAGLVMDGLPYQQLAVKALFSSSGLDFEPLELITPAFSARAIGTVGLINQDMEIDAVITVLNTLDKLLGFVPFVGRTAADLTKVYLKISGELTDPAVRAQPAEAITAGMGSVLQMPLGILQFNEERSD